VYVYDYRGNYLKTVRGAYLGVLAPTTWNFATYLQADGNARKAYLVNGTQLQILDY